MEAFQLQSCINHLLGCLCTSLRVNCFHQSPAHSQGTNAPLAAASPAARVPPRQRVTDPVQVFHSQSPRKAGWLGNAGLLCGSGGMWMGRVGLEGCGWDVLC